MKILLRITLVFLVAGLPSAGYAEFYRYKSSSGVTIFTDDLSKVPVSQRSLAVSYEETVSEDEAQGEGEPGDSPEEESRSDGETETGEAGPEEAGVEDVAHENTLETLNQRQIALDQEYADLLSEKKDLENTKSKFDSKEELTVYHEKIVNLNERISDYEARRQAFSQAVDAFSARRKNRTSIHE